VSVCARPAPALAQEPPREQYNAAGSGDEDAEDHAGMIPSEPDGPAAGIGAASGSQHDPVEPGVVRRQAKHQRDDGEKHDSCGRSHGEKYG
jgi:hypothetical protein